MENTISSPALENPETSEPANPYVVPLFFRRIDAPDRLGLDYNLRVGLTTVTGFMSGFILGWSHGSSKASFRFRAENSHRFPTTSKGWYLYHKSKSYRSTLGGLKEGLKLGPQIAGGAACFFFVEELVDQQREKRDFLSTVTAGLTFSGVYSLLSRQDLHTAGRTARTALKWSLLYGLTQDMVSFAKGNRVRYIDFMLGRSKSDDAVI